MEIPLYQVDAFARRVFSGNPAAVCPLDQWLPDETLQSIAAENNVSETAFFVPSPDGDHYDLRWFTPTVEVDLCGHATLASAYVLLSVIGTGDDEVCFRTRSGDLMVSREGELFSIDLPARPGRRIEPPSELLSALGGNEPEEIWQARDYMAVYADEQHVRALLPDMAKLAAMDMFGVIVTAPGRTVDFVSRFFAPARGIPEDPVTGSAHCTLVPYWAQRLGRDTLESRQISTRGGELRCHNRGDRVTLAGSAALYSTGVIHLR